MREKAKAVAEGRYLHEVFAEIVERGLAAVEEAEAKGGKRGKSWGNPRRSWLACWPNGLVILR